MALKENELVAPRTREMILQYAQKSGYIPSLAQENQKVEPLAGYDIV